MGTAVRWSVTDGQLNEIPTLVPMEVHESHAANLPNIGKIGKVPYYIQTALQCTGGFLKHWDLQKHICVSKLGNHWSLVHIMACWYANAGLSNLGTYFSEIWINIRQFLGDIFKFIFMHENNCIWLIFEWNMFSEAHLTIREHWFSIGARQSII